MSEKCDTPTCEQPKEPGFRWCYECEILGIGLDWLQSEERSDESMQN